MNRLKTQRQAIVVGLDWTQPCDAFVRSCISLARQLRAPVELVHAVTATSPSSSFDLMGPADVIINPYYGYEKALAELEEAEAQRKLKEIEARFPAPLEVRSHVIRDTPAQALLTIAQEVRAGLIVCGLAAKTPHNTFHGVSTAFSLATHGDSPLMLLPLSVSIDFQSPLGMLIADNLEVEGRFALENALRLAEDLASSSIFHVHVHSRKVEEIKAFAAKVQAAEASGQLSSPQPPMAGAGPGTAALSGPHYLEQIQQRITDDLVYRFHNSEGAQQLAATYEAKIAFGDHAEELQKVCAETGARIMVFGRHLLIHRRSFSLGKLPSQAVLQENAAIVVVPDADRRAIRGRSRDR